MILTESEQKIFDFLLAVVRHFNLDVTMRVAGGWVRNKLLDLEADDIDIALDTMMGTKFAEYVIKYQKEQKMVTRSIGLFWFGLVCFALLSIDTLLKTVARGI